MSADELSSARVKVKWANKYISELDACLATFKRSNPYVLRDHNPAARQYRVDLTDEPGEVEIALRAADIIQHLRAALDYVGYQCWLRNWSPKDDRGKDLAFKFPISENANEYEAYRERIKQSLGQRPVELIDKIEPYSGGRGTPLRWLAYLNNREKHRLILTIGLARRSHVFPGAMLGGMQLGSIGAQLGSGPSVTPASFIALKQGADITATPSEMKVNPQFTFEVAFDEPPIVKRQPMLPTVQQFSEIVSGVIDAFEVVFR